MSYFSYFKNIFLYMFICLLISCNLLKTDNDKSPFITIQNRDLLDSLITDNCGKVYQEYLFKLDAGADYRDIKNIQWHINGDSVGSHDSITLLQTWSKPGYFRIKAVMINAGKYDSAVINFRVGVTEGSHNILFVGNSITLHSPKPEIGWYGNWGMAASSRENDYVHQTVDMLKMTGIDIEFSVVNIAEWETSFSSYNINDLSQYRDLNATVIIINVGENISNNAAIPKNLGAEFDSLITFLNVERNAIVIIVNSFWPKRNVDSMMHYATFLNNCEFIDISDLFDDKSNTALSEYINKQVGDHPSDKGMHEIAVMIVNSLEHYLK